ncbi:hypothetical protein HOE04_03665 [archaeon]|jgi:hypothetical protein|nr:hypothetical protein [archaeon]
MEIKPKIQKLVANTIGPVFILGSMSLVSAFYASPSTAGLEKESESLDYQIRNRPIVGTVLEESYENTLVPNEEFDGLVSYSNETVKLDSKYTLKIETSSGKILGVSIIDGGNVAKESLDILVEEGSKIRFPREGSQDRKETYFNENTQMGTKRASRIEILNLK